MNLRQYFQGICVGIVLFLSVTVLFGAGVFAISNESVSNQSILIKVTSLSNSPMEYQGNLPLMHFTKDQLDEMQDRIIEAPQYTASQQIFALAQTPPTGLKNPLPLIVPTGLKSLLPYLPYTPSERDQGVCDDCWVWAATGALEIDHNVESGINNRLSVQYFNSKYNSGTGSD